jgi:exopolysaccharide biosynthesis polyprenyl glycosylphosphotransferase
MTTTEVASGYTQTQGKVRATQRVRKAAWRVSLLPLDALTITAGIVLAELGAARAHVPPTRLAVLIGFPALTLAVLAFRGTYRPRARTTIFEDLRAVLTSSALAAMVVLTVRAAVSTDPAIAQQGARLWAYAAAFVIAGRVTHYWTERSHRRSGEGLTPTLIVGAGRVGRLTAERLLAMPQLGLKPIGFLDKDPLAPDDDGRTVLPVLGASWDLEEVVREHGVEQIIICFSKAPNHVLLRLIRRCEELGLAVSTVPRLYELTTNRLTVEHLGGLPLLTAHPTNPRGLQFAAKYMGDRFVSAMLIVLLSPVLLGAGLATYLSLGRPIFYRQRRVGRDGAPFDMLKFRTMKSAEQGSSSFALQEGLAPGGVEGADRRTAVGRWLRRTSVDELPQLFNVLLGQMSMVGPRPERPEFAARFGDFVYRYGDRLRVKSGITGWAQVNGLRGQTSIADRAEWDNYYIENFSLWLDAKILLMTVAAVFTGYKTVE